MLPTRPAWAVPALLVSLLVTASPVLSSELTERVAATVAEKVDAAVAVRHHLHQHPELSNREHETAATIAEALRGLGLEPVTGIAHTGVTARLDGGRPGPLVAVRADIDALPVTEETELPFRSSVRTTYGGQEVGVSHACGHDVHAAVALGVASTLVEHADELPGSVLFVFQPAEEGTPMGEDGGARMMVDEGVLAEAPAAIFALHSWPELDVGEVGVAAGPMWAAVDRFRVVLAGRQAHGAEPHLGIDPVVLAAQAVMALQTIPSRTLDPQQPVVLTVGVIRGGERYNIIPGEVVLEGTVRTYSTDAQETVERRMHEILGGLTTAAGGSYELVYERVTPATLNDAELHELATATFVDLLGAEAVHTVVPTMAGEDFAYFSELVPGYYYRLGVRRPGGASGGLHTPTFTADDGAVEVGMRTMTRLVLEALDAAAH